MRLQNLVWIGVVMLVGCGQKGELYLPTSSPVSTPVSVQLPVDEQDF